MLADSVSSGREKGVREERGEGMGGSHIIFINFYYTCVEVCLDVSAVCLQYVCYRSLTLCVCVCVCVLQGCFCH